MEVDDLLTGKGRRCLTNFTTAAYAPGPPGARLLRKQITAQLKELDTQDENLIDLAADSTLPRTKVEEKLRDIAREQPDQLSQRCNDQQRRLLNQAIFHAIQGQRAAATGAEGTTKKDHPRCGWSWLAVRRCGPTAQPSFRHLF
ncbi:hypothetical protein ACWEF6_10730 [Amycolatopsis sp. NPDC004772]